MIESPVFYPLRSQRRQRHATTAPARRVWAALWLALTMAVIPRPVAAGDGDALRYVRIATGTSSGTYFTVGSLLANAISNPPGGRPCDRGGSCGVPGVIAVAQATSGGVANLDMLRSGAVDAALVQANLAQWAYRGSGVYQGRPPFDDLRAIAALYTETVQIVVRADSPIRTIADLRRHRISVGEAGTAIAIDARMILGGLGLSEKSYTAVFLKPSPSADQLIEGKIDAMFLVGGAPFAAITDAATRIPIRLIAITSTDVRDPQNKASAFSEAHIPAETYPDVPETPTLGVAALLVVRAALDETLVAGITRALWHPRSQRALEDGFAKGRFLPLPIARDSVSIPLHPGADAFYRDAAPPPK